MFRAKNVLSKAIPTLVLNALHQGARVSQRMQFKKPNSYTKTNTQKKRKLTTTKGSVKAMMLKTIDNHHSTVSDLTLILVPGIGGFTHNTLYSNNATQSITQGTTNANRMGDKVHLDSIVINGLFSTAATAGAYTYRVLVLWSGNEYSTGATFTSGLTFSEIFLPSTGGSYVTTSVINPKAVTCLYDEVIDINSTVAATSDLATFRTRIPLRQEFAYESSGSIYGKTKNLYLVVMGSVTGGTPGTTQLGTVAVSYDLIFKPL